MSEMKKIKVMTVLGTRPEIIRLSRILASLDRHTDHINVHTGQNYDYELNEVFFNELEIRKPDYFLNAAGETPSETVGQVIIKIDPILAAEQPEALLILGDTNSCLAAYPVKRRKIPIFHMEAGNRCFDQRVPEEINRKIIDHISDINLPYTEHGRRYLIAEGIKPETIIKTGSPMTEVLQYYQPQIEKSKILDRLQLVSGEFFLASAHREENIDQEDNFANLLESFRAIHSAYGKEVIVTTHPRTRKRLQEKGAEQIDGCRFIKPLGFIDYVKLQQEAFCVISDSGTITEESSILNIPAVIIRQAHERQEGMDEGSLIMSGLRPDRLLQAINIVTSEHSRHERRFRQPPDYEPLNVSDKVIRIIMSYIGYVNRTVWYDSNQ